MSEKISQSSIKNENTLAIFKEIAASNGISRAEISANTGLSLMTVGKVADMLTKEGMITQIKPATGSAGRRAGMLAISEKHFILSLDLSTLKFRATVINLKLQAIDSIVYPYNDSLFPEDNLIIFFRDTSTLLMKHLLNKKLLGTGICVPGEYDEKNDTIISPRLKQLCDIKISETMKKSIGFTPDRIMNSVTAAAISEISELPEDKRDCAINLNIDSGVCGCIVLKGKVLNRPSDFESLICENGKTLAANLFERAENIDEENLSHQIGSALCSLISVLCPDSVFISGTERNFTEWFSEMLSKELSTANCKPQVFFENSKNSRSDTGISQILRDKSIKEL